MAPIDPLLRTLDRRPKAKRRFNLLLGEVPEPSPFRKKLSALACVVFFAGVLAAGIWQIRTAGAPTGGKPNVLAGFGQISEANASLPGSLSAAGLLLDETAQPPVPPVAEKSLPPEKGDSPEGRAVQEDRSGQSGNPVPEAAVRGPADRKPPALAQRARRSPSARNKAQILYRKALAYHRHENFEMAVEMYRRVLLETPGHRDALFQLSSIHMERSEYDDAYPLIVEMLKRHPADPQGLANLAVSEIALGRPERAIAHLDEALALEDPPRFKIYLHQGVARSKLRRLDEAIAWYRKAEELDPGHALLLFNMAVTLDRLERYKEALACYARYLKAAQASCPRERREVETRIGLLMAYLVEEPEASSAGATHRPTE